ncbi:YbaN family protein [Rhodanobacter sp. AS-Z3]|uniref:YbaN family protein n=1 Tax=Rhodanobacter sp. AS-Z3 TaxID=3031330 RepID=UPI0024785F5E|nr:YbaN family protein [Rhodanobacter sp. AS-Z3]WEN15049.1 YbaN family protein [Rhodanobacter sp. AS-Z3]
MPNSPVPPTSRSRFVRGVLFGVGALSLLLGLLGIFLPLLPTVPFLLLTAACWSRASPRWHRWLLSRPRLGPVIKRWEQERSVSRRTRRTALLMVTVSMLATIAWFHAHPWLPWMLAGLMVVLLLVIARLPTSRDESR